MVRGQMALQRGQVETAAGWLREAATPMRAHLAALGGQVLAWNLGCLAEAEALRGDAAAAQAAVAEADRVCRSRCR